MTHKREKEIKEACLAVGIIPDRLELKNNGHYAIHSDKLKRLVFTGSTPSDHRANLELKRELKHAMINSPAKDSASRGVSSLTTEERQQLDEELKKASENGGVLVREVMDKFKLTRKAVNNVVMRLREKGFDIKVKRVGRDNALIKRTTEEQKQKLFSLLDAGVSTKEAAAEVGIAYGTAWDIQSKRKKKLAASGAQNAMPSYLKSNAKAALNGSQDIDFKGALTSLASLVDVNEQLKAEVERLKSENEDMRAKFKIMQEALTL